MQAIVSGLGPSGATTAGAEGNSAGQPRTASSPGYPVGLPTAASGMACPSCKGSLSDLVHKMSLPILQGSIFTFAVAVTASVLEGQQLQVSVEWMRVHP